MSEGGKRADEGFLGRWSRRKRREGGAETPGGPEGEGATTQGHQGPAAGSAGQAGTDVHPGDAGPADTAPREDDATILQRLGLPHPDELTDPEALRRFLSEKVPAHLRRIALGRLWRLDPVLSNLDGLNDYDEDFTGKGAAGLVKTAWRAGTGYARAASAEDGDAAKAGESPLAHEERPTGAAPGVGHRGADETAPTAAGRTTAGGGQRPLVGQGEAAQPTDAEPPETTAKQEQPTAEDAKPPADDAPRPSARKRMRFVVKRP